MKSWKYALTAALLPASLWAATLNVTVGAPAPGTPVAGVFVILTNGSSTGTHVDSGMTSGTGLYQFTNVSVGAHTLLVSKSGYNNVVALVNPAINTAGQTASQNVTTTINNRTSTIQGVAKKATDSSFAIGATVTLSGGTDSPRQTTTDSSGHYQFDSVLTSTGYNVAVALAGYQGTSTGNVGVAWNSNTNVPTMYLTPNLGSLSGTVRRNDSTTIVIPNAKVVLSIGTAKVDSVLTDVNGNYSIVVNAASYTLAVSASGFKSLRGNDTVMLTATVTFGSNTVQNAGLTPAHATIAGTLRGTNATTGPIVASATVTLQRRLASTGATNVWYNLDSTVTDVNGIYVFSDLIAATGTTGGNYRLTVHAAGYRNYPSTTTEGNVVYTVVAGGTTNVTNFFLTTCTASPTSAGCVVGILSNSHEKSQNIHLTLMGQNLALELGASNVARTVQIFNLNGSLAHQVTVFAGETRAIVPATFAAGYLFQVK